MKKSYFILISLLLLVLVSAFQLVKPSDFLSELTRQLKTYNSQYPEEKVYVQTDKPFYKPGETIWFNAFVLDANSHQATQLSDVVYVELLDTRGKVASTAELRVAKGTAHGDFKLKAQAPGGIYTIRAYTTWMKNFGKESIFTKELTVQHIITPRLLLNMDFEKEAYGPGDLVTAELRVENLKNEKVGNAEIRFTALVSGREIVNSTATTDDEGLALIQFNLPESLNSADGLINAIVSVNGVEESVARSIPIVLDKINLQFFPEGGHHLLGVESQIAFKAVNEFGKGADVSGIITDEDGREITRFESFHMGMGAFKLTPERGARYFARIESPIGNIDPIPLPKALARGFRLNLTKQDSTELEWSIYAPIHTRAYLIGNSHGEISYAQPLSLMAGLNSVKLDTKDLPVGITAFTLFDGAGTEQCERLVFLNKGKGLRIALKTDQQQYQPREHVRVDIKTTDSAGKPVRANLSLAVVDDQLLSFADDKQDHMLSSLLLSTEVSGEVQEPSFYFDPEEPDADKALDYLLMTQGWRRFTWQEVKDRSRKIVYIPENITQLGGVVLNKRGVGFATEVTLMEMGGKKRIVKIPTTENGHFLFKNIDPEVRVLLLTKKPGEIHLQSHASPFYALKENGKMQIGEVDNDGKGADIEGTDPTETTPKKAAGFSLNLEPETTSLSEVVITGMGISTSQSITGSVVSVYPGNTDFPVGNVTDILQGQVPGLQIQNQSGNAGSGSQIIIRGQNSFASGNSQPLYVLDGTPLGSDANVNFMFGSLVGPDDIKSISVLKSAQAMALYGSAAANGVILINTKSGLGYGYYHDRKLRPGKFSSVNVQARSFTASRRFYVSPPVQRSVARNDFRTTIHWEPNVMTDQAGEASIYFYNNDAVSAFRIVAEGFTSNGAIGRKEAVYYTQKPLSVDVKFPEFLGFEDVLKLPVRLKNETASAITGVLKLDLPPGLGSEQRTEQNVRVNAGQTETVYFTVLPRGREGSFPVKLSFRSSRYYDEVQHTFKVRPVGFPVHFSMADKSLDMTVPVDIQDVELNSLKATLTIYPSIINDLFDGAASIFRQPYGCFEQVSSSTYPNILALQFMQESGTVNEEVRSKALTYIADGYDRLTAYEIREGGFEWFGRPPGHEGLSAFGLLQFAEMKKVYPKVSNAMMKRTRNWLLSKRDGKGGFRQHRGKYGFSGASKDVTNAYILFALSETGTRNLIQEYENSLKEALKSQDMYRMALVAHTAFNLGKTSDYEELIKHFVKTVTDPETTGFQADHSIVRSYGRSLETEIWALWTTALLKNDSPDIRTIEACIQKIARQRKRGGFGSTQATGLALKALTSYAKLVRSESQGGEVELLVNHQRADRLSYTKDNKEKLQSHFQDKLKLNKTNDISVRFNNTTEPLAYALDLQWYTRLPPSSKECQVSLTTSMSRTRVKVNETVRLTARLTNKTAKGIPMTVAVIGIPAGLSLQAWQLKEMKEKEEFDFYEITDGNLVVYYREMGPDEVKTLNLDLKAEVNGAYLGTASSAYLYYTSEYKHYTKGERIVVE